MSKLAWVIGTGPSLNKIDMSKLADQRTITFNRAYIAFEDWGFHPSYYLVIDSNDARSIYKDINLLIAEDKIEKFFLTPCDDNDKHKSEHFQDQEKVSSRNEMFKKSNSVYFIERWVPPGGPQVKDLSIFGTLMDNDNNRLYSPHEPNAGWMGVLALYAMGYTEVAFVGCDSKYQDDEDYNKESEITQVSYGEYLSNANKDQNHFRKDYFGTGQRFGKPNQATILNVWENGKSKIDTLDNFSVYSCTEGSALNKWFDYIPFEDFLNGKRK